MIVQMNSLTDFGPGSVISVPESLVFLSTIMSVLLRNTFVFLPNLNFFGRLGRDHFVMY